MKTISKKEYEHINWLLKRVKKEIKRKDENLDLLDWNSTQADRLSGQIEAFEHIEMLINEIGKPSYFRNKHRESEETKERKDIELLKEQIKIEIRMWDGAEDGWSEEAIDKIFNLIDKFLSSDKGGNCDDKKD